MDSVTVSRDYRRMKGALMIKAYEESGMSLREWLQQNNVSKDKYYYWRRKLRDCQLDEIFSGTEVQDILMSCFHGQRICLRQFVSLRSLNSIMKSPAIPRYGLLYWNSRR